MVRPSRLSSMVNSVRAWITALVASSVMSWLHVHAAWSASQDCRTDSTDLQAADTLAVSGGSVQPSVVVDGHHEAARAVRRTVIASSSNRRSWDVGRTQPRPGQGPAAEQAGGYVRHVPVGAG